MNAQVTLHFFIYVQLLDWKVTSTDAIWPNKCPVRISTGEISFSLDATNCHKDENLLVSKGTFYLQSVVFSERLIILNTHPNTLGKFGEADVTYSPSFSKVTITSINFASRTNRNVCRNFHRFFFLGIGRRGESPNFVCLLIRKNGVFGVMLWMKEMVQVVLKHTSTSSIFLRRNFELFNTRNI